MKVPVDDWLCRKFEKLNLTVQEGYPTRNSETASLNKDQFIKPPPPSQDTQLVWNAHGEEELFPV